VLNALEKARYQVEIPADIREKALTAIEKMISI